MIQDAVTAWFGLLLGLSGIGAILTVAVRFLRASTGGLR